jgi:hypothetical protein
MTTKLDIEFPQAQTVGNRTCYTDLPDWRVIGSCNSIDTDIADEVDVVDFSTLMMKELQQQSALSTIAR